MNSSTRTCQGKLFAATRCETRENLQTAESRSKEKWRKRGDEGTRKNQVCSSAPPTHPPSHPLSIEWGGRSEGPRKRPSKKEKGTRKGRGGGGRRKKKTFHRCHPMPATFGFSDPPVVAATSLGRCCVFNCNSISVVGCIQVAAHQMEVPVQRLMFQSRGVPRRFLFLPSHCCDPSRRRTVTELLMASLLT